jgi:hypothetical protein
MSKHWNLCHWLHLLLLLMVQSILLDSETNVNNDPHLHHLTQDQVALVNEQAALDPNKKDLSDASQQDFEEFMAALQFSPCCNDTTC